MRTTGRFVPWSLAIVLVLGSTASSTRAQPRPNIVLVFVDDLGYGDIEPFGQARIRTPHLDRLAREGMRFTQAYATAPVCAPSRCGLLTGLHTGHCSVDRNAYPNLPLGAEEISLGEILEAAGYATGVVGKWGMGGERIDGTPWNEHSAPWNRGFGESLVVLDHELAHDYYVDWLWRDGEREWIEANAGSARGRYTHDLFADEALRFVRDHAHDPEPFFLYAAFTIPHREITVPSLAPYEAEPWPEVERAFAAMLTRLDADIGRLVAELERSGIADRTLIVFTSDNGPQQNDGHSASFFDSNGPFRGIKRDLYEGGIRVPLVASWPGTVPAGTTTSRPVSVADLLPTFAELAGIAPPRDIDGRSLARTLQGTTGDVEHEVLYWSFTEDGAGPGETPARHATRRGRWKLIEKLDGSMELYDVAADPGETVDLAASRPADVGALRGDRATETAQRPRASFPVLELTGDLATAPLEVREARPATPVLHLRFDDVGASAGSIATTLRDSAPAPSLLATAAELARFVAREPAVTIPRTGERSELALQLDPDRPSYVSVPHHPAISFGAESFTIESYVRLEPRAAGLDAGSRQWLVAKKRFGRSDDELDYGVLVRAGDLARPPRGISARADVDGRELAMAFGDGLGAPGSLYVVASSLRVEDDAWHHVSFAFDAETQSVRFTLDDREEHMAIEPMRHAENTGPLLIGAHSNARGVLNQGLAGAIDEVRVSRGLVPREALLPGARASTAPRELRIAFGEIERSAGPVRRRFRIRNGAVEHGLALDAVVTPVGDAGPAITLDRTRVRLVAAGAESDELTLTLLPSEAPRSGLVRAEFELRGSTYRLGHAALGSPLRIVVEAQVIDAASIDGGRVPSAHRPAATSGCTCGLGAGPDAGGALLGLLGVAMLVLRRSLR